MATVEKDVSAQLRKGVVEFAVLALLEPAPKYGWQLAQELIDQGRFIASIGTLYPVLTRLRAKGWVTSYEETTGTGPPRRYYQLSDTGVDSLEQFRGQWTFFSQSLSSLMRKEE